jgi:hypothetical protein
MNGCNNLGKKQVSCRVEDLPKVLLKNVDEVGELGDMQNGFCDREINVEMSYTSDECVECSIGGFGFNSVNEERSEDKTTTRYDDRENGEILEQNWEQEEQTSWRRGEDKRDKGYVKDRGAGNLNVSRRCRFQWKGVECDILNDDGVFIA